MLKLVHALEMNFSCVEEYYNSFSDKWYDLNCYAIRLANEGFDKYFDWISRFEKNMYYLIDDDNPGYIVGFGSIETDYRRLYSNEGNIGYGVRPSERNKGYGTLLLKLLLEKCMELGMKEVGVSCIETNISSKRVIEKNNGYFEKRFFNHYGGNYGLKYRISLSPEIVYKTDVSNDSQETKGKGLRKLLKFIFK